MAWYALQIAVALATYIWIGETFGLQDRGLAPAVVSMFVAWIVTESVSKVMGWLRSLRSIAVGHKFQRDTGRRWRSLGHSGDSPELARRPRIGEDRRQLPKIAP